MKLNKQTRFMFWLTLVLSVIANLLWMVEYTPSLFTQFLLTVAFMAFVVGFTAIITEVI